MATQTSGDVVRIEPPRAAGAPGVWETSHELVVPAGGPWVHATAILVVSARDNDSDEIGEYRLFNVTQNVGSASTAFGLEEDLRLVVDNPASGDLLHIQRRPFAAGSDAWVIEAAVTFHDQDLGDTSPSDYGPPAAVVLTATGLDGGFTLTFTPPLGVLVGPALMQYGFREQGAETFTYSATGDVDGSFTVSAGLTNDVAHEAVVRFRADSDGEWGAWSNEAPFTPTAGGAPTPPGQMTNFGVTG